MKKYLKLLTLSELEKIGVVESEVVVELDDSYKKLLSEMLKIGIKKWITCITGVFWGSSK